MRARIHALLVGLVLLAPVSITHALVNGAPDAVSLTAVPELDPGLGGQAALLLGAALLMALGRRRRAAQH